MKNILYFIIAILIAGGLFTIAPAKTVEAYSTSQCSRAYDNQINVPIIWGNIKRSGVPSGYDNRAVGAYVYLYEVFGDKKSDEVLRAVGTATTDACGTYVFNLTDYGYSLNDVYGRRAKFLIAAQYNGYWQSGKRHTTKFSSKPVKKVNLTIKETDRYYGSNYLSGLSHRDSYSGYYPYSYYGGYYNYPYYGIYYDPTVTYYPNAFYGDYSYDDYSYPSSTTGYEVYSYENPNTYDYGYYSPSTSDTQYTSVPYSSSNYDDYTSPYYSYGSDDNSTSPYYSYGVDNSSSSPYYSDGSPDSSNNSVSPYYSYGADDNSTSPYYSYGSGSDTGSTYYSYAPDGTSSPYYSY